MPLMGMGIVTGMRVMVGLRSLAQLESIHSYMQLSTAIVLFLGGGLASWWWTPALPTVGIPGRGRRIELTQESPPCLQS